MREHSQPLADSTDRATRRGALRVVTYNVHRCIGVDGRGSVERIAEVLAELEPDVVGLQEVLSSESLPSVGQLERLAEATGLQAVAGGTLVDDEGGRFGNGLLLRHPLVELDRHDLSVPGSEPRGALEVVIDTGEEPARVIATHLGLNRRERRHQIGLLEALVSRRPEPILALLGDMNEWRRRPFRDPLRALGGRLVPVPIARTFPSRRPMVPLDRVWVDSSLELLASGPHRSPLSRVASDHLPLFADVRRPEPTASGDPESRGEPPPL